jgi:hypothetical protein
MPTTREDVLSWRGQTLLDNDGDKIGTIEEIYLDAETNEPEWAVVKTGLFGNKSSFVPISEASPSGDGVRVAFDKATVKDAPNVDPDGRLSQQEERELYAHYNREYSEFSGPGGSGVLDRDVDTTTTTGRDRDVDTDVGRGERGGPGGDVSGPNTDEAMTRSEEELHLGTTERESGRVRLKKYVVEDEVTETVPVRREEVRVEREPITDARSWPRSARSRRSACASTRTSPPRRRRSPRPSARSASTSTTPAALAKYPISGDSPRLCAL